MNLPRLTSHVAADGTCTTMVGATVVAVSYVPPTEVSLPAWPWRRTATRRRSGPAGSGIDGT